MNIVGRELRLPYAATILSMLQKEQAAISEMYVERFGENIVADMPEYNGTCMGSLCYPVREGYVRVPYVFKAHPAGPILDVARAKQISREAYMNLANVALAEAQKRVADARELTETISARNGTYTVEQTKQMIQESPYESTIIKAGMDYRKITYTYEIGVMGYVIILCKDGKVGYMYASSGSRGVEIIPEQSLSDAECLKIVNNYMKDKKESDREIRALTF